MIPLDTKEHKTHITNLLLSLYKDSFLANLLGFKGGTAAMLFYELPRFSVDLDFDLTQKMSVDKDLEIEQIIDRITELVEKKYEVKKQDRKYFTLFWLVSYGREKVNIKIEISIRDRKDSQYKTKQLFGTSIKVLRIEDMIAHKLVATLNRKSPANRDLFDAHFFLSSPHAAEINTKILQNYIEGSTKDFYEKLLLHVKQVNPRTTLEGLGELLSTKQKVWVKEHMLTELEGLIERQIYLQK